MHAEEPSLQNHLDQIRSVNIPEGGLSNILICIKHPFDHDVEVSMQFHRYLENLISDSLLHSSNRKIVEDEVSDVCNITGILIAQGNTLIHFLECPSFHMLRLIRALSQDPFQANGKIIYCVEDRPLRIYADW